MATARLKIGAKAPEFNLTGVDGKNYSLDSFKDSKALVIIFSCNHCPYVQAYEDRIITLQSDYKDKGVSVVAINSNDITNYPDDSFEHMIERAIIVSEGSNLNFNNREIFGQQRNLAKRFY